MIFRQFVHSMDKVCSSISFMTAFLSVLCNVKIPRQMQIWGIFDSPDMTITDQPHSYSYSPGYCVHLYNAVYCVQSYSPIGANGSTQVQNRLRLRVKSKIMCHLGPLHWTVAQYGSTMSHSYMSLYTE